MTILLVIIAFIALFAVAILWLPILLTIDTENSRYDVRLKGLATISAEEDPREIIRLNLKVFFMRFTFYPLRRKRRKPVKKLASAKEKKKGKHIALKKMLKVLRSFRVKRLLVDMDTGDYVLNAKLYPVFMLLNSTKGTFSINFEDRNRLVLQIQNRPIHILRSIINL